MRQHRIASLDPRLVIHAHDVGVLVVGEREAGVGQEPALFITMVMEMGNFTVMFIVNLTKKYCNVQLCIPPGDGVGRELVLSGALESDDGL